MDKRYQVFVSSTYKDLQEERAEIMQALLELDCMPAGMELFPAANEEQWNWIKKVIDESDYYIVIVAGRYGSISDATKLSYTEMEYRYAIEIEKPVIAFLHEDTSKIEAGKCEQSPELREKLNEFRVLCQKRLCKYWSSPADLGAKASRSLTQLIKHQPAIGWVRADQIIEDKSPEILRLRNRIEELEKQLKEVKLEESHLIENLARGSDEFEIRFSYETEKAKINIEGVKKWVKSNEFRDKIKVTWDNIFAFLAPKIKPFRNRNSVAKDLNVLIKSYFSKEFKKKHRNYRLANIRIYSSDLDVIEVQFRALGLIDIDEDDWTLTRQGDTYLIRLLTQKKPENLDDIPF